MAMTVSSSHFLSSVDNPDLYSWSVEWYAFVDIYYLVAMNSIHSSKTLLGNSVAGRRNTAKNFSTIAPGSAATWSCSCCACACFRFTVGEVLCGAFAYTGVAKVPIYIVHLVNKRNTAKNFSTIAPGSAATWSCSCCACACFRFTVGEVLCGAFAYTGVAEVPIYIVHLVNK
ncbi:hypothetical protein ACLOJK_041774 [Asimina triloba]